MACIKGFSKEEIKEYQEAFKSFDKNGDGRLSFKELREIIKMSDADLKRLMDRIDKDTQTQKNKEKYREVFKQFDKDGNGTITVKEFKKGMTLIGGKMSEKDIKKMVKEVDLDGDGCINYKEFEQLMANQMM